ncbi:hypothetical protein SEA_HUWBERT_20 [Microbacterium phage Huwbert]|nr:hypothetical protein SEA_HUWBERT_20 [Microbacterium phage Huwbert]
MARGESFYKVTIESGVPDDSKYQSRTFIIDEEDDELLWMLLQRIKTREGQWQQQQQRRTQEKIARERLRREQEERARAQREWARGRAERERQANQNSGSGSFGPGGPSYTFGANFANGDAWSRLFEDVYGQYNGPGYQPPRSGDPGPTFRGRDDGFRTNARQEPKTSTRMKSNKEKLADMAEVAWETAQDMDTKKLLKMAQRKCHPDTGGSHEKWIKLDELKRGMGL